MRAIACHDCGTRVLVEKFSPAHTSVQWTSDATTSCPEFAGWVATGAGSAVPRTCGALRDSIDRAVAAGEVAITTRDMP